jgi:GNAT superfamily N-acetyltransferase
MQAVVELGRDRADDFAMLVTEALPGERLSEDELVACCFDDPGVVLALADGTGVVSAVARDFDGFVMGWIKLVAVAEDARGTGRGRALVSAAEQRLFDAGASEIHLASSAPFYLWPGVPGDALGMLCLAEAMHFERTGSELNMSIPTTFRAPPPTDAVVRRVVDDPDAKAVVEFTRAHWSTWVDELRRAIEQGGCHAVFDDADRSVVGFACHSVNRAGWIGPMGTDPERRGRGSGHALLSELCKDLMAANLRDGEIAWVGPVRFYAKAGARVSRMFGSYRKRKP